MSFVNYLKEGKWSGTVKTKKHPPDELFASGSAEEITKWLKKEHSDLKSAMDSLDFYINRAGSNLPESRKTVLDKVKKDIRNEYKK